MPRRVERQVGAARREPPRAHRAATPRRAKPLPIARASCDAEGMTRSVAVILAGGVAKGAFEAGALQVIAERGIRVRRIVAGEGVERKFPLHSPRISRVSISRPSLSNSSKLRSTVPEKTA